MIMTDEDALFLKNLGLYIRKYQVTPDQFDEPIKDKEKYRTELFLSLVPIGLKVFAKTVFT